MSGRRNEPAADRRGEFALRLAPHRKNLVILARRWTTSQADAEDVLQAALLAAWKSFVGSVGEVADFGAWVFRHLVHECRNHARREARLRGRRVSLEDFVDGGAGVFETLERDLACASETPLLDPVRLREWIDERLMSALAGLDEHERLAFLLRSVADLDTDEIAAATDSPKGTVMSRIFRAREKLRRTLSIYAKERGLGAGVDTRRRIEP